MNKIMLSVAEISEIQCMKAGWSVLVTRQKKYFFKHVRVFAVRPTN